MDQNNQLNVSFLGKFKVAYKGVNLEGLGNQKVQELLAYLLLRKQRHTREHLANLLWVDVSKENSRKNLRHALWQLQRALKCHLCDRALKIIQIEGNFVWVTCRQEVCFDVANIELAWHKNKGIRGRDLSKEQYHSIKNAVKQYQGRLLPDWYQDWCIFERERLQNLYLILIDKLMAYCEFHGLYESGLVYGNDILRYDYSRERTHRRMMLLYYRAGFRTAALRQYETCRGVLMDELGVEPAHSTQTLYRQISLDQISGSNLNKSTDYSFAQLAKIQQTLLNLQIQIDECLKKITPPIS